MDLFPDRAFVRLRTTRPRAVLYLHAHEDGVGVSLSRRRASPNSAWVVHRVERDGVRYLLLHGAAYGRYLALAPARPPRHPVRAIQRSYESRSLQDDLLWEPVGLHDDDGVVFLRNLRFGYICKADHPSVKVAWTVEAIPPRPQPPLLPPLPPIPQINRGGFRGLFLLHEEPVVLQRTIRYVRADNLGNFDLDPNGWPSFQFHGRSVFNLRLEVAEHVGLAIFFFRVIVCVRAGRYGRPTPLRIDLPRNEETLDVVAIVIGTPAAGALRYPNVDAF